MGCKSWYPLQGMALLACHVEELGQAAPPLPHCCPVAKQRRSILCLPNKGLPIQQAQTSQPNAPLSSYINKQNEQDID